MNKVFVGLGSNLQCPERQIRQGLRSLKALPHTILLHYAPLYRNPAWGRQGQPAYVNTIALLVTRLSPFQLLQHCQKIENLQGRVRKVKWASRTIDIDILIFGDRKLQHPRLKIPHPYMWERDFVHIPLTELLERYCK